MTSFLVPEISESRCGRCTQAEHAATIRAPESSNCNSQLYSTCLSEVIARSSLGAALTLNGKSQTPRYARGAAHGWPLAANDPETSSSAQCRIAYSLISQRCSA